MKLDRSEKIVKGASGIALDAAMVAPGVFAGVAFDWKLLEKIFVAVVAIFAGGLAGLAPLEQRPSELLADDALVISVVVECIESGTAFMVSNVGLCLVDVGSEGDFFNFEAASGSPSGTFFWARIFVVEILAGVNFFLFGTVFCRASVAFLRGGSRILIVKLLNNF